MFIIAGLGNPERKYDGTKHNIGFSAITALSDAYNIPVNTREHKALCGKGYIEGQKVLLAMPLTYMNLSGESIRELVDYYKINPEEELIIIYDDINLAPGKLRIRAKGSAGGHNGIKNIITHIGSQSFYRIRIGVGEKPEGWDLADYVLSRFNREDEPVIREALQDTVEACKVIMLEDIRTAMNKFN
ncbi:MAG: aminoacyl-tRNA hydrolase [Lachnospiraceae bacterium]|jgi:peptidyl-tRNA hydrolase|nr:aminoacyl-tRNA hydrolase [Lachnospiraceae bacterium]